MLRIIKIDKVFLVPNLSRSHTWVISAAVNGGYPFLKAFAAVPSPDITTQSTGPGHALGTTELTVTPNASSDTFAYVLGSASASQPSVGNSLPSGAQPYTSGTDIFEYQCWSVPGYLRNQRE